MENLKKKFEETYRDELICFAQEIIKIRSYSSEEGKLAEFIKEKMASLNYDEVYIDSIGNVVGRIGDGPISVMLDSHMDVVEAQNDDSWEYPPFEAEIHNGRLYGRGSVDMKGALAATVYGAVFARDMGWIDGHTVYITCTVNEEDCDGQNLKSLFQEKELRPDYFVTCEPSSNEITVGHNGKTQVLIKTKGVGSSACRPHLGVNAVYKMADIIKRVEQLNERLTAKGTPHGTVALSQISCVSASVNAVPSECSIYLDRRMVVGETAEDIRKEMDALVEGTDATWELGTLESISWTGKQIKYNPLHEAWKTDEQHPLTVACRAAYEEVYDKPYGGNYFFREGSTNAVTPVSLGIPCIGFGPGEAVMCHRSNENCSVEEIVAAAQFYARLIHQLK